MGEGGGGGEGGILKGAKYFQRQKEWLTYMYRAKIEKDA